MLTARVEIAVWALLPFVAGEGVTTMLKIMSAILDSEEAPITKADIDANEISHGALKSEVQHLNSCKVRPWKSRFGTTNFVLRSE